MTVAGTTTKTSFLLKSLPPPSIAPPTSLSPPSPPILCSQCTNYIEGDIVYCDFSCATDPLYCWRHVLVLRPGQWQQQPTTVQHQHSDDDDGTVVSCWCL
eukprot:15356703-Ditylum_brightwellii.AAC.1